MMFLLVILIFFSSISYVSAQDDVYPIINQQYPAHKSYIVGNGTQIFTVNYTEENMKKVMLFWAGPNDPVFKNITLSGCSPGINQVCSQSIDLLGYPDGKIEYTFVVYDENSCSLDPYLVYFYDKTGLPDNCYKGFKKYVCPGSICMDVTMCDVCGCCDRNGLPTSPDTDYVPYIIKDSKPPIFYRINVNAFDTYAIVTWSLNTHGRSELEYGTTTDYGLTTGLIDGQCYDCWKSYFNVTLSHLSSGTTYHFKIRAEDFVGHSNSTIDYNFTTKGIPTTTTTMPSDGDGNGSAPSMALLCSKTTTNCMLSCKGCPSSGYDYCVYSYDSSCNETLEKYGKNIIGMLMPGEKIPWITCGSAGKCTLSGRPTVAITTTTTTIPLTNCDEICNKKTTNCAISCKKCPVGYDYCEYTWESRCKNQAGILLPGVSIPWSTCNYAGTCTLEGCYGLTPF